MTTKKIPGAAGESSTPGTRGRKGPDPDLKARMVALGAQLPAAPTPAPRRPAAASKAKTAAPAAAEPAAPPAPAKRGPGRPRKDAAAAAPSKAAAAAPAKKSTPAKTAVRKAAPPPMPAEQPRATPYTARLSLTTTPEQNRALALARLDDGVDTTARIRAMIALWQEDERIRRRIDKLSQHWK